MSHDRNKQDRRFLHDFATPMSVLRLVLLKIGSGIESDGSDPKQVEANLALLDRAQRALETMEKIHADFKVSVYDREIADGHDPVERVTDRQKMQRQG